MSPFSGSTSWLPFDTLQALRQAKAAGARTTAIVNVHGTLYLIHERAPTVFLVPPREQKELYEMTLSSIEEVRARRGKVIAISFDEARGSFDEQVLLPKASRWIAPFLHLLAGQLLAYETAITLGRNVDRPRSLGKSVTVS